MSGFQNALRHLAHGCARRHTVEISSRGHDVLHLYIVKAQDAVKEVSKAGGYTVVYDTSVNAVAYFDEAVVTDILPAVKTKLGIKDTPAAAPAAPAAK